MTKDIENLKQQLQVCEQRFRGVFETAAIGMALVSLEGKFIEVNDTLAASVGYAKEELVKKTFQEITHPDDLETDLDYVKQMLAGEREAYQMEKRYFHKDGSIVWVLLSVSLAKDIGGQPLYFVSQIEDITRKKNAEADLLAAKERFELALKGATDGIWDWDIKTNEVYFSPRWKAMVGYADDEITNEFSQWEKLLHPEDVERALQYVQEYVASKGEKPFDMEFRMKHKDGHWVDILARAYLALDNEGNPSRMVGTHVDMTERKQIEKQLETNEIRFRSLFDNMSSGVAVYIYDKEKDDFVFVDLNQSGAKISNVKKEDVVGKGVKEVFSAVTEIGLYDVFVEVNQTGDPKDHPTVFYKDEKMANWVDNYVYKLPTGEIVAVYDDVTNEKQAESALKAKVGELEQLNKLMTGRELKMVELKNKIKELNGDA